MAPNGPYLTALQLSLYISCKINIAFFYLKRQDKLLYMIYNFVPKESFCIYYVLQD
jgi:hypothetical protein